MPVRCQCRGRGVPLLCSSCSASKLRDQPETDEHAGGLGRRFRSSGAVSAGCLGSVALPRAVFLRAAYGVAAMPASRFRPPTWRWSRAACALVRGPPGRQRDDPAALSRCSQASGQTAPPRVRHERQIGDSDSRLPGSQAARSRPPSPSAGRSARAARTGSRLVSIAPSGLAQRGCALSTRRSAGR